MDLDGLGPTETDPVRAKAWKTLTAELEGRDVDPALAAAFDLMADVGGPPGTLFAARDNLNSERGPISSASFHRDDEAAMTCALRAAAARLARAWHREQETGIGAPDGDDGPDPLWTLTMHRAVLGILAHHGVDPARAEPGVAGVEAAITARLRMLRIVADAGRVHPLALNIPLRQGLSAHLFATFAHGDGRTALHLPALLPDVEMVALGGRPLADLVDMPGVPTGTRIAEVVPGAASGCTVTLDHDDVPLAGAPPGQPRRWLAFAA